MSQKAKILIVDDEEVMRSLFSDLLGDQGHEVSCAQNGKEAMGLVKEKIFQIAFIDVHMPVMNGIETLRAIKEISPQTTIVMMDSFPDILVEEAKREGAITCIHKPFNIQEVIEVVQEILERIQKV